MLVLSRKVAQSIMIGNDIEIVISSIEGDQVKIGLKAPSSINILRKEIYESVRLSNKEAVTANFDIGKLKKNKFLSKYINYL